MPGTNAGTGYPITLGCRHRTSWGSCLSRDLSATGATRPLPRSRHHHGYRQTTRLIQYRCHRCGHLGWTQHMDGERLLLRRLKTSG